MFDSGEEGRTQVPHDGDVPALARAALRFGDGVESKAPGDVAGDAAQALEFANRLLLSTPTADERAERLQRQRDVGGDRFGEDLNLDRLMQRARDRGVAQERTPASRPGPDGRSQMPGLLAADVALLHASYDTPRVEFTSHRSILGPFIVLAKRFVRQLLTPVLARQVAYNAANTRVTSYLAERAEVLDRLAQRLAEQAQSLTALEMRLRDEIAAREALATYVRDETIARETLEKHAWGETTARETLERHLRGETAARETLARHLRGESAARETLARDLRGEIVAREMLAQHLRGETAARETLETTFREAAREISAARRALADRVALAERKLRRLFLRLTADVSEVTPRGPVSSPVSQPEATPAAPAFDYAGFEDRFRGEEQDIKDRQRRYLTVFEGQHDVLDIGCGRGEFLELCRETGICARGVELDLDMVLTCRDKNLDVVQADAFRFLAALPDESLGGILAAQLIEHLQPSAIVDLVKLCHRKLRVGGRAIFETPNPGCLLVFARSFYADPTHIRPIHSDAMKFLLESVGFDAVTVEFSAPIEAAARIPLLPEDGLEAVRAFNQGLERLNDVIFGFQDYAVIGTKALPIL